MSNEDSISPLQAPAKIEEANQALFNYPQSSGETSNKEIFWGIPNKYMDFLLQIIATFATIWVAWKGYRFFGSTVGGVAFLNKQLMNNTITDIQFTFDSCPEGFSEIDYGSYWPGTSNGCFCPTNNSVYNGYFLVTECNTAQKSHGCMNVVATSPQVLSRWRGQKKICIKRDPNYNFMYLLPSISNFLTYVSNGNDPRNFTPTCNIDEKTCGETLCIPQNAECPIIDIEIGKIPSAPDFINSTVKFDNQIDGSNLYIYKNNFNSNITLNNFFPLVDLYMSAGVICANAESVSYNFPPNFNLAMNQFCDADSRFVIIDSLTDQQFFHYNNFTYVPNQVHYQITNDSNDWHLAYVKAPGLYYINCLQMVYPGDPELIQYFIMKFINFLTYAPFRTGLTVLLQKMTFFYALIMGICSIIMSLIYLIADECKYDLITCFKGTLAEKAKKLISAQIFVEIFIVYGGTAALSYLIIQQSNVYKKELEEIRTTNCLDQSTKESFVDLFNAVDSNQDSNIANIIIFLISFLFIIIGKCLLKTRDLVHKFKKNRKYLLYKNIDDSKNKKLIDQSNISVEITSSETQDNNQSINDADQNLNISSSVSTNFNSNE